MMLNGLRIIENPNIVPVPRMQVSADFARLQSPELVASTNAWMREFFGTYLPVYVIGRTAQMHPKHIATLKLKGHHE
jgi:hypothetical protein